jgi:hypothetical protein
MPTPKTSAVYLTRTRPMIRERIAEIISSTVAV